MKQYKIQLRPCTAVGWMLGSLEAFGVRAFAGPRRRRGWEGYVPRRACIRVWSENVGGAGECGGEVPGMDGV